MDSGRRRNIFGACGVESHGSVIFLAYHEAAFQGGIGFLVGN